jgi:hypothetical protein
MVTTAYRIMTAPIAALMRLLRASAELHPLVFCLSPHDEQVSYQSNRPY